MWGSWQGDTAAVLSVSSWGAFPWLCTLNDGAEVGEMDIAQADMFPFSFSPCRSTSEFTVEVEQPAIECKT